MNRDSNLSRPKQARRLVTQMFLALVLLGGGLLAVGSTVNAAPPYETEATVTDLTFVETEITNGRDAQMTANWSFPDDPTAPLGFTIDLPPTMAGRGESFPITAQDTGEKIGSCVATPTQLQCDIDAAYAAANPKDLHGDVKFWVSVRDEITETTTKTYTFGEHDVTVTVNPTPGECTTDCPFVWDLRKDGITNYGENAITWYIHIAAPREGMAGGEVITVTDYPGANLAMVRDDVFPMLTETNELGTQGGTTRPVNFTRVPRSEYTLRDDNSMTFTAKKGYFYEIRYRTTVTDGGAAEVYTNRAVVEIEGQEPGEVTGQARWSGGSGTGIGTNVGVFTIAKNVTGDAVIPADKEFTGTYVVTPPTGDPVNGTWTVKAGETWRSPEFPRGSTVVLTEDTVTGPGNVVWESPDFSTNNFPLPGGEITPVTLTNTATVPTGSFSVKKSLSGPAAALVPAGTEFTIDWAYPAGEGYEAGQGTITVVADGEAVTVDDIPDGAVVTLTETTPDPVDGVKWLDPIFSENGVTVVGGETYAIDLDNPTELRTGTFSVLKKLEGSAASQVPDDTEFQVDYSYPAGEGYEAGEGSLTVTANGEAVQSPALPYGAEVTLTEAAPEEIEGTAWEDARFSTDTLTIGDDTTVEITLTNTIGDVPPEETPPTETTPPTHTTPPGTTPPTTPWLPETGSPVGAGSVLAALALMLAGGLTVLYGRRRPGTHS